MKINASTPANYTIFMLNYLQDRNWSNENAFAFAFSIMSLAFITGLIIASLVVVYTLITAGTWINLNIVLILSSFFLIIMLAAAFLTI